MLEEHSELESNVMGTIKQGKFHLNASSWSSEIVVWSRQGYIEASLFLLIMEDGNKELTLSAKVKLHRVSLNNFSLKRRALILIDENYSGNYRLQIPMSH